ncbi:hypothetical protein KQI84_09240 [bacterium]|nr:hypothetical protein [bacterium]
MESSKPKPAHPYRRKAILLTVFALGMFIVLWLAVLRPRFLSDDYFPSGTNLQVSIGESIASGPQSVEEISAGPHVFPVEVSAYVHREHQPWETYIEVGAEGSVQSIIMHWSENDQFCTLHWNDGGGVRVHLSLLNGGAQGAWRRTDTGEWEEAAPEFSQISDLPPELENVAEEIREIGEASREVNFGQSRRYFWMIGTKGIRSRTWGFSRRLSTHRHDRFPRKGEHKDLAQYAVKILDSVVEEYGDQDVAEWFADIPAQMPGSSESSSSAELHEGS